ncbi:MAG: hypothetical protein RL190_688 [Actinomycetota bacterium]
MTEYAPLDPPDALDEIIARAAVRWPDYMNGFLAESARRQLLIDLGEIRRARGLTQTQVAATMGTSQSAVAKLERGESDPRMSTVARFALAVGHRIEYAIVPLSDDSAVGTQRSA